MSTTTKQRITVVAVILVVAAVPLVYQIGDVRAAQATSHERTERVERTVTARQATNDYDGDGIPDSKDRCPQRPETDNGFRDGDGCPDVVETTGAS